ncbi:hypothetical protein HT574_09930 [Parageobacillus sp. VR-IP]|uniref:hypothetical protein n=1 Tax=Parageobacillus sp. VR-IP TaxID=2742205 RepID=UPI001581C6FC|nr:hypothetical protein [Parageobacillus sp. VR-IP]NUK30398.1 hypothetical protein [Parageobacillus sp. VR-IP]
MCKVADKSKVNGPIYLVRKTGAKIVNFPGNPKGVQECFAVVQPVLPHALALIKGKDVH